MSPGQLWTVIGLYCLIGAIVLGVIFWKAKQKNRTMFTEIDPLWAKVACSVFLILGWPLVVIKQWQQ